MSFLTNLFGYSKKTLKKNDEYFEQELRRLSKKIREEKLAAANLAAVRQASKSHLWK